WTSWSSASIGLDSDPECPADKLIASRFCDAAHLTQRQSWRGRDSRPKSPWPRNAAASVVGKRLSKDTPKSRRTRVRILDAAMRLFADIGYHAASNAEIAKAAGLTRGAMLYHFATREALVEAAGEHIQQARLGLFDAAAADPPPGGDATTHAIAAYWRLLAEPPFVAFAELEAVGR